MHTSEIKKIVDIPILWENLTLLEKRLVEVAKKSGCLNSILIHSQSEIPFDLIKNANTIGVSSGASAPEILVNNFINELKNKFTVSIDEVEIIKENVVFKAPKKLN